MSDARSVVVIDDDRDMQALIRVALQPRPELRLVGEAASGEPGLSLVRNEQPDLVILNHYLDAGDLGLDLAPALKEAAPHTKVLLFSAHDLTIEAGREPAVDVFLNKRRVTSLLATVSALLELAG